MAFPGIIGHSKVQEILARQLEHGTLPHSLLFVGPGRVGKTTLALALARELLNHTGDVSAHPDYVSIQRLIDEKTGKKKTQISVAQIRELNVRLGMTSLSGGWKLVFIEEADKLSVGAVNALLKTLEEPKGKTLFLLRASSIEQLPATVVSRCQLLRCTQATREEIVEGLIKMGFARSDAQDAAAQSLGRPGRAIAFLKNSEYRAEVETRLQQALSFFSSGLPGRLAQVMEIIPKAEEQKDRVLLSTLGSWELVCRDLLLRKIGLTSLQTFSHKSLDDLAQTVSSRELISIFSRLHEVRAASSSNINAHLSLEHIALS